MNSQTIEVSTSEKRQLVNITSKIKEVVANSGVENGLCLVFTPHATAAVLLNEEEPGFKSDLIKHLGMWVPENDWEHDKIDDNASSHIAASLIGQERTIPISGGSLQLGTWQDIFLVETDGPRNSRRVIVQIIGA